MASKVGNAICKIGFFLVILCLFGMVETGFSQTPTVTGVSISSSTGDNSINGNITADYLLGGSSTTSATNWRRNGLPAMTLFLPFEGGATGAYQDYSGNGIVMSSTGAVNWSSSTGHDGHGAFVFNGSSYLTSPTGFPVNSSYTTTAWINQTAYNGYSFIVGSSSAGLAGHGIRLTYDGYLSAGHNNNWRIAVAAPQYHNEYNVWYFVAVTYDNTTGEMILYRDGVPVDTGFALGSQMIVNDPTIEIGATKGSSNFIGEIDDTRVYNYVLSPEQIQTMYEANGENIINAFENNVGDDWQAEITPFSATEAGVTVSSNTLTIVPTVPSFTSSPNLAGINGKKYRYTATADGGPYPTFALTIAPVGMTIDTLSGEVLWNPNASGNFDVTITATNTQGSDIQSFTIAVAEPSVGVENLQLQALGNGNLESSHTNVLNAVTSSTAWYKNNQPFMELYMPFEGGAKFSMEDYSGNEHPVIQIGDPVYVPNGDRNGNGAYDFDGDDFLLAGDIFPTLSSYTKTIWLYHTLSGNFEHMLSSWDHNTAPGGGHGIRVSFDDRIAAGQNGNWRIVESPSGSVHLNTWYFAAVSFDFNTGVMLLYLNGVRVDSAIVDLNRRNVTDPSVLVGATQGRFAFTGMLDDPRIFDKVLSPEQIAAMYTANGDNIIVENETTDGDSWQSFVTAFSPTEASAPIASNQLIIGASNQPPTLATIGAQSVNEGDTLSVLVIASDPDLTFPALTTSTLPANAQFIDHNDGTGTFTFAPDFTQAGIYDITFTASDGLESDSEVVSITVNNVNLPAQLDAIANQNVDEGSLLEFTITGTDPDNDSLIFSSSPLISNMTFTDNFDGSATFSFIPSFLQAGVYQVTFYVTDNSPAIDSQTIQITVSDIPQNALWTASIHTEGDIVGSAVTYAEVVIGVQSNETRTPASPAPPEYSTNIQLIGNDNTGPYYRDIQRVGSDCYFWVIEVDPHGNAGNPIDIHCTDIRWDPNEFSPDYNYVLREGTDPSGAVVVADMRSTTSYQVCDVQTAHFYTISWESNACSGVVFSSLSLTAGWNLISLPVTPSSSALNELFPTAEVAFEYNNGYGEVTDLYPCSAYWVRVPNDITVLLSGTEVSDCSMALTAGWNLVGVPNCSAIPATTPSGEIQSIFSYDNGYNPETSTIPGFGYWVNVTQNCTIDINCAAPVSGYNANTNAYSKPAANAVRFTASRSAAKMVSNVSVEIGVDESGHSVTIPPTAPEQSVLLKLYDTNWDGPYYQDVTSFNEEKSVWYIAVNPVGTEATASSKTAHLSWSFDSSSDDVYTLYKGIGTEGDVIVADMQTTNSIDVTGTKADQLFTVVRVGKGTEGLPTDFALNQNYPNPFNPATEISFSLPTPQQVRLEVYNIVGQLVKTLVDGQIEAGVHSVSWNSPDQSEHKVSSGIYLYRLSSDSFTQTKKMVLLK